ncbi:hypothetical protein ACFOWE_31825 [Planomonospora corallina]|uniref:Uncharacterized protein n=1 Tax=Planomonospora corallina TaxID=1806052 RepID=A0ABV8IFM2_9ACTN
MDETNELTRAQRLALTAAALRGIAAGIANAVMTWLLHQLIS